MSAHYYLNLPISTCLHIITYIYLYQHVYILLPIITYINMSALFGYSIYYKLVKIYLGISDHYRKLGGGGHFKFEIFGLQLH